MHDRPTRRQFYFPDEKRFRPYPQQWVRAYFLSRNDHEDHDMAGHSQSEPHILDSIRDGVRFFR